MVDFKKDTWLYALIAAVLLIISILTPWGSLEVSAGGASATIFSWLTGAIAYVDGDVPLAGLSEGWAGAGAQAWTFGLTMLSLGLLLFYGIHSWKGMEFKWDWLVYLLIGIVLIIFPILALAFEYTEDGIIGFAPIGIIIAGVICIAAFVVDKFVGRGGGGM